MTEKHETDQTPEAVSPGPQPETPPPVFRPFVEAPQPKQSRGPLLFIGLSVAVLLGGVAFWNNQPDQAEAQPAVVAVNQMTAEQLAKRADPAAARELVRRLFHGTEAEHAGAAAVMNRPRSMRLSRNLAMAMASENQKRASEMKLRVEREIRETEQGL